MADIFNVAGQSENYCLFYQTGNWFFCLTKSEWAAWIQAIFSVVSIIVAFSIANNQTKRNIKYQNKVRKELAEISRVRFMGLLNQNESIANDHLNVLQNFPASHVPSMLFWIDLVEENLKKIQQPDAQSFADLLYYGEEVASSISNYYAYVQSVKTTLEMNSVGIKFFKEKVIDLKNDENEFRGTTERFKTAKLYMELLKVKSNIARMELELLARKKQN